jgi:hypothetical protein
MSASCVTGDDGCAVRRPSIRWQGVGAKDGLRLLACDLVRIVLLNDGQLPVAGESRRLRAGLENSR